MSLTSLSTLSTLEQTGPRRITDLASCEGVTQPSMTALASTLERSGLVERRADPADGRVALVALTSEGRQYIRDRRQAGVDIFAELINELSSDDVAALAGASTALARLQRLDEERRYPSKVSPPSSTGDIHS